MMRKILVIFLALATIFAFMPFVLPIQAKNEGIKFLVLLQKQNGERVSAPISVILQPKYYKLTIEKSNLNGEFYFIVPINYFANKIIERKNLYVLYNAYTFAGLKYLIPKYEYPNITLVIFGEKGLYVYNYTVYLTLWGDLLDVYPIEITLPNDFKPYSIPYLKEQSFYSPINKTIIPLSYHQTYIPGKEYGFNEERVILTPFEYKFYNAKLDYLITLKIEKLAPVNDTELAFTNWLVYHSETYNQLAWGVNIPLDAEELKYYTHILQEIWG